MTPVPSRTRGTDPRPRRCPVDELRPGDVVEVYVCIENDDYEWVHRTVVAVDPVVREITYADGDRTYSVLYERGRTERLAFTDEPLTWEGDGA
jgi:hypothetical protein